MIRVVALWVLSALLSSAAPAGAEAPPPVAGVGVLERDGTRSCSGVLIAPDLVATAGHCAARPIGPDEGQMQIRFLTGAYPGHAGAGFAVARAMRHPIGAAGDLSGDIAVLQLAEPVPAEVARPIPPGPPARPGEHLILATWPAGLGARARERACDALEIRRVLATLGCAVIAGESGGGVLRITPEGPHLAAIVVARDQAGRQPLTQAVQVQDRLAQLRAIYGF